MFKIVKLNVLFLPLPTEDFIKIFLKYQPKFISPKYIWAKKIEKNP